MNTNSSFNLSIVIGLIIIGLVITLYLQSKKKKYKSNYRLFFIFGMIWLPLGIVFYKTTGNNGFLIMGLIFLIIGLVNKDRWDEPEVVNPKKRKLLIGLILAGFLIFSTFLWRFFK